MTCQEAIDYIYSMRLRGKKKGLEHIRELLTLLGNPEEGLSFVHIAGTNGKGSTTTMVASVLEAAGYKTGRFISPFILNFRERMQIDGEMIPEETLVACVEEARPHVEAMAARGACPSEFELVTALAMLYFKRENCQIVALEVGLGGRLDATNAIPRSLVSVLTAIGLDHMEILGDTIEKIAGEKCGILRKDSVTVSYPDQPPEALGVIFECCARENNRLILGNKHAVEIHSMTLGGSDITYGGLRLHVPLIGLHQIYNCITVVETLFALRERGYTIPDEAIRAGIAKTSFPARMEILQRFPLVLVDGAHNDAGAKVLGEALSLVEGPITAIIGMLGDKDTAGALSHIAPRCRRILTVTPQENHRALEGRTLAEQAKRYCGDVTAFESLAEAYAAGYEGLLPGEALLICGSLYLAADMREIAAAYRAAHKIQ